MKHKGHSGFGLWASNNVMKKWTQGTESTHLLRASCNLQEMESKTGFLAPVKTVEVINASGSDYEFEFEMPLLDYETAFTTKLKTGAMGNNIYQSFKNRSGRIQHTGFKRLVKNYLTLNQWAINESTSTYKMIIEAELSTLPNDSYPSGFPHGDFGFANMLVDNSGDIWMVDFTPSFIYSPLMDLATMELSLRSDEAGPHHVAIFNHCMTLFSEYKKHKDIIRMCKVLSFFKDIQNKERSEELRDMFYGRIDRSSNI